MKKLLLLCLFCLSLLNCWSSVTAQSLPGPGNCLTFGLGTSVICGANNRGIRQFATLEAWVKTTSYANQWVFGKYSDASGEERGYHLATWNGTAIMAGRTGNGVYCTTGFSRVRVDDGNWHHLAGVIDNNVWQIYVDGVLESSTTQSYALADLRTSVPLQIGDYYDQPGSRTFSGEIDEVRIWNVARSENQIRQTMCSRISPVPTSLVAYYRFDQTTGLVATDAGSSPQNGTLANFSAQPWHRSGAALGDRSAFSYASGGGAGPADIQLVSLSGDTVSAQNFSPFAKGVQLYLVNSPPSVLPIGGTSPFYFGVFMPEPATAPSYLAALRPANCRRLYTRPDNSASGWSAAPLVPLPNAVATNGAYRGEFAGTNSTSTQPLAITGPTQICPGQTATLTAVAPSASLRWNTGATTASTQITGPGTYSVVANYTNGCTGTASFTVSTPPALRPFSLGSDTTLCSASSLLLTAPTLPSGARRQWSDGSSEPTLTVQRAGTYALSIIHPCDTLSAQIQVSFVDDSPLIIPNIITPNNDQLNDFFTVPPSCSGGTWELTIYSNWGRRLYHAKAYANDWGASDLAAGTYYYHLYQPQTDQQLKGWVEVVR